MSADLALPVVPAAGRRPGLVVGWQTARKSVRSGLIWGVVFGVTVASQALTYASTYKTAAQRAHLVALFGSNKGLAAIAGPARHIDTVSGFVAWKSFLFLAVIGAVWGLLTATRLTRGEEEAGRWELLLAGHTTRRRAAAQAVAGLGSGLLALWGVTAASMVAAGRSPKVHIGGGSALFFAVALVAPAAMFLAAGLLFGQLAATRRQAAGYAVAMLGVSFALRMVADSDSSMSWLRWASPLGWVEELRPLTGSRSLALVPILAFTIVVAGLAVHIAGVRDLGGSVLPDRECPRPHLWLLDGSFALGVRLARPTVTGWMVAIAAMALLMGSIAAIAAMALLMGSIAKQAGSLLTSTPGVEKAVARLGVHGDGAAAYLGFTFVFIAVLVAFIAVGQLTAARAEEAEGRLDNLLVRPVSRAAWLLGRLALTIAIVIAGGVLAGATADAGLASQGAGVGSTRLLGAGINVVPPTLCILGVGVLVLGLWPRATSAVMYGMLAWSFLIGLVGGLFSSNHWLLDTSVFHHMATAPATAPNWQSAGVLVLIAVITGAVGVVGFRRRDLAPE